jgi:hypothetical protein
MNRPIHTSFRGATLRLFLEVYQDPDTQIDGTETVTADLKLLPGNNPQAALPGDAAPVVASLTVTWQAASGGDPAGWHIVGGAADTDGLAPAFYVTDARIVLGNGEVERAAPITIDLHQHVTRPT